MSSVFPVYVLELQCAVCWWKKQQQVQVAIQLLQEIPTHWK